MPEYIPSFHYHFKPACPGSPGAFLVNSEWFTIPDVPEFINDFFSDASLFDIEATQNLKEENSRLEDDVNTLTNVDEKWELGVDDQLELLMEIADDLDSNVKDSLNEIIEAFALLKKEVEEIKNPPKSAKVKG